MFTDLVSVYQPAEDSPHVEEILDELLCLPDKESFLPACWTGQLQTAVPLVKFLVKPCEFRSSLWAGVVLIRGASAGVGCEQPLLSDRVCSTEGIRWALADLGVSISILYWELLQWLCCSARVLWGRAIVSLELLEGFMAYGRVQEPFQDVEEYPAFGLGWRT